MLPQASIQSKILSSYVPQVEGDKDAAIIALPSDMSQRIIQARLSKFAPALDNTGNYRKIQNSVPKNSQVQTRMIVSVENQDSIKLKRESTMGSTNGKVRFADSFEQGKNYSWKQFISIRDSINNQKDQPARPILSKTYKTMGTDSFNDSTSYSKHSPVETKPSNGQKTVKFDKKVIVLILPVVESMFDNSVDIK